MASCVQGYDEDRFVTKINRNFFCLICFKVLRDPVICPKNQHCFCRSCVTKHLETTQSCPTCADHLTVKTLIDATRIVKDYLNESSIRCVYIERGCQEILQLNKLDEHEAACGFTPVVCTNESCGVIVSRRDLVHHESEACEFRKLKCHSCEETTKTLREIEKRMTKMEASIKGNVQETRKNVEKNKGELKQELQADMANLKRDLEGQFVAVNREVGGLKAALVLCLDEMKNVLVKMESDRKTEITSDGRSRPSGDRENILVAGGCGINSVEMFNWREKVWLSLPSLPEKRHAATSFVYNNHVTIAGGCGAGYNEVDTMIRLHVEASPDLSTHWYKCPVKLSAKLANHSSVVYNDQLIVTGGSSVDGITSDCIHELQLGDPYTSKILSKMPEQRQRHCSEMFDDNLLIVGGRTSHRDQDSLNSVLLYDVKKNEYKHLAPLPYEVHSFATVKYGDNIAIIGGSDKRGKVLNTVVMYNVVTQQSHMLPPMKCKRFGCAAVVLGNNIVVMGGYGGRRISKSVEVFSFNSYTWTNLPEMSEERWHHAAVAV